MPCCVERVVCCPFRLSALQLGSMSVWRCALLRGEDGLLSIVTVCFAIGFEVCVEVCPAAWRGWSAVHCDCLFVIVCL